MFACAPLTAITLGLFLLLHLGGPGAPTPPLLHDSPPLQRHGTGTDPPTHLPSPFRYAPPRSTRFSPLYSHLFDHSLLDCGRPPLRGTSSTIVADWEFDDLPTRPRPTVDLPTRSPPLRSDWPLWYAYLDRPIPSHSGTFSHSHMPHHPTLSYRSTLEHSPVDYSLVGWVTRGKDALLKIPHHIFSFLYSSIRTPVDFDEIRTTGTVATPPAHEKCLSMRIADNENLLYIAPFGGVVWTDNAIQRDSAEKSKVDFPNHTKDYLATEQLVYKTNSGRSFVHSSIFDYHFESPRSQINFVRVYASSNTYRSLEEIFGNELIVTITTMDSFEIYYKGLLAFLSRIEQTTVRKLISSLYSYTCEELNTFHRNMIALSDITQIIYNLCNVNACTRFTVTGCETLFRTLFAHVYFAIPDDVVRSTLLARMIYNGMSSLCFIYGYCGFACVDKLGKNMFLFMIQYTYGNGIVILLMLVPLIFVTYSELIFVNNEKSLQRGGLAKQRKKKPKTAEDLLNVEFVEAVVHKLEKVQCKSDVRPFNIFLPLIGKEFGHFVFITIEKLKDYSRGIVYDSDYSSDAEYKNHARQILSYVGSHENLEFVYDASYQEQFCTYTCGHHSLIARILFAHNIDPSQYTLTEIEPVTAMLKNIYKNGLRGRMAVFSLENVFQLKRNEIVPNLIPMPILTASYTNAMKETAEIRKAMSEIQAQKKKKKDVVVKSRKHRSKSSDKSRRKDKKRDSSTEAQIKPVCSKELATALFITAFVHLNSKEPGILESTLQLICGHSKGANTNSVYYGIGRCFHASDKWSNAVWRAHKNVIQRSCFEPTIVKHATYDEEVPAWRLNEEGWEVYHIWKNTNWGELCTSQSKAAHTIFHTTEAETNTDTRFVKTVSARSGFALRLHNHHLVFDGVPSWYVRGERTRNELAELTAQRTVDPHAPVPIHDMQYSRLIKNMTSIEAITEDIAYRIDNGTFSTSDVDYASLNLAQLKFFNSKPGGRLSQCMAREALIEFVRRSPAASIPPEDLDPFKNTIAKPVNIAQRESMWAHKRLLNTGNSCFINCVLQLLAQCTDFLAALQCYNRNVEEPSELSSDTLHILSRLTSVGKPALSRRTLHRYRTTVNNAFPEFCNEEEQDCDEFLSKVFEFWKDESSRNHLPCPLSAITFTHVTNIRCDRHSSTTHTSHTTLQLYLSGGGDSIESLVDATFRESTMQNYHCPHCQRTTGYRSERIASPAKYFILNIIRMDSNSNKITRRLTIKEELPLSLFTRDQNDVNTIYSATSVICHIGTSLFNGHYLTYVRALASTDDIWLRCSDSEVIEVSAEEVFEKAGTSCAHILYVRNEDETPA